MDCRKKLLKLNAEDRLRIALIDKIRQQTTQPEEGSKAADQNGAVLHLQTIVYFDSVIETLESNLNLN